MTLGTPQDVTLQELRIETFFPVDEASERTWRSLVTAAVGDAEATGRHPGKLCGVACHQARLKMRGFEVVHLRGRSSRCTATADTILRRSRWLAADRKAAPMNCAGWLAIRSSPEAASEGWWT